MDSVMRYTVSGDTLTMTGWVLKDAVFVRRR